MDKKDVVHIYNGVLLNHKKEQSNAIDSNLDTTTDAHTKSEGKRQTWYHLYVESNIWDKWTSLQNRDRLMDINNRLVVAKGEGAAEGMDWQIAVRRCKLLNIEQVNNKVLLYSTENYIQYPVITIMEKIQKIT